ncbi:MAG TPA: amidohydrolase family protein, partial [Burkholderiales bacterium]|nr:amidohydrolase family protein [Burkholderiales bacterium]
MLKYPLLIRNATVVDGTRAPRFQADIAVAGGRIAAIGRIPDRGELEIDASRKIAAPGFIDAHTHDDRLMLSAPDMAAKVSQGVTTVVAGNCGFTIAPTRPEHHDVIVGTLENVEDMDAATLAAGIP